MACFYSATLAWNPTAVDKSGRPVKVDGVDVMPEINAVLERMSAYAKGTRSGSIGRPMASASASGPKRQHPTGGIG